MVNLSWDIRFRQIEQSVNELADVLDPDDKHMLARALFNTERDGLHSALASTPDILYGASAGNFSHDTTFDESMWASMRDLSNLLIVGAADRVGGQAGFTSYGAAVDHAIGCDVISTVPGGALMTFSGASMAVAAVTNLVAKLIALDPTVTANDASELVRPGC